MESRTNVGYKADETAGRYIPTIFPADALNQFGRTFDDFRCCILDIRRVSSMAPKVGRLYRMRTTVVVGNGKGIYGIGTVQSEEYMDAIVAARKYAFENLQSAPMFEERTVPSDGYYQHNATHCLIRRQPEGFGIKANPILRRICDVIGYKDIHVKTRGSRTPMSLINCFARCLNEPETDQERADINGYNVVEIDPQRGCRPTRIAEPRTGKRTSPYPLDAHFFKQKIQKDLFNVSLNFIVKKLKLQKLERLLGLIPPERVQNLQSRSRWQNGSLIHGPGRVPSPTRSSAVSLDSRYLHARNGEND